MTQESIRQILAKELGADLKPRLTAQTETPEHQAPPMALNDNRQLKAAILDSIQNEPTQKERTSAAAAQQRKAALREQILDALDINKNGN